MLNSKPYKIYLTSIFVLTLAACNSPNNSERISEKDSVSEAHKVEQVNSQAREKLAQQEALQNPDWVAVDTLSLEWSGLYQKDCDIGGPEKSSFFDYRDHRSNTEYYFAYIVYPSSLNKKPKASVVPITASVWQNKKLADHYLLFRNGSFSQVLINDGWSRGLHQTLDGKVWDMNLNYATSYRKTDAVRWAVDVTNASDYGSRSPCPIKLAKAWSGQTFKSKDGKSYQLDELITAP